MHKLVPVCQFGSHLSLVRSPSSRKPIIVPGASFTLVGYPNVLECAEGYDMREQPAQQQQQQQHHHHSVSVLVALV